MRLVDLICPTVYPGTEHHAMKAYWEAKLQLHSFFDLGIR
jgi:hypothetical protein